MSDGFKGAAQLIGEAVVKPTVDTVGEMVELGVQSVTGAPPTLKQQIKADPQKLAAEDNRKKRNIMQFLQNYKQQEHKQAQISQQKVQEKKQEVAQTDQKIQQFEFAKKQDSNLRQVELQRAKTRAERKGGVGG